ncbi:MAG: endonuclease/exonuclease/phosphatase family protein [Kangiellaceae bacterium]
MKRLLTLILLLALSTSVWSDIVTPVSRTVNWINVRAEPIAGSEIPIVAHLHKDEHATFIETVGSYHKIRMSYGTIGFVASSWTDVLPTPSDNIKIATFNIQSFGKTKAGKPEVMKELASVIRKYDLVAIQEIKNKAGVVPTQFLTEINSDGSQYAFVISERGGKEPDDQSSQEQYAYYFNTSTIKVLKDVGLYDDSVNDFFQREPYVVRFAATQGNLKFVLATIHTKPEEAVAEIKAMHDALVWAQEQFTDEEDFIALGDFNAGCNYASPSDLSDLKITLDYNWIVPHEADTNFSANSSCAYDRIVVTEDVLEDFTNMWGVDTSVSNKKVSDHFPVWFELKVNSDL